VVENVLNLLKSLDFTVFKLTVGGTVDNGWT